MDNILFESNEREFHIKENVKEDKNFDVLIKQGSKTRKIYSNLSILDLSILGSAITAFTVDRMLMNEIGDQYFTD